MMAKSLRCEAVDGNGSAQAEKPGDKRWQAHQNAVPVPVAPTLPTGAAFYQACIEQATDLVSVLSKDGTLRYVSPSHQRTLGYAPEALIGKNAFTFVHPDDLAAIRARFGLATTNKGQTASGLYRFRHADGSWRMIEAVGTNLLGDPAVAGIVVNARDVTERELWQQNAREELEARVRERTAELVGVNETLRAEIFERQRAEESLRQSEARYRHLVEQINEVIFTIDAEGRLTYVSPAIERVAGGRSADGVLGRSFLEFVHPDDVPAITSSFARLLAGQPEPLEYRVIGPDGNIYWMHSHSQAIVEDGRVVAVHGVLTDITARRQMEMEARQQREGLAHVQRLTTAGAMTAEIAHQMNQPLTAIMNFAGGLAARLRDGDLEPTVIREVTERIATEALRVHDVIHRLRTFPRKGESVPRDCDLNQIVRHVYGLLEEDFRRDAVEVTLDFDPRLPICCVDPILIEQVVLNLLRNASDALRGTTEPRSLRIETRVADASIEVAVRDSGIGLPPNAEKHIFDAFYTTKPDGLGLGLSVSRSIIDASGGQLWVQRNAPRGTTVGFSIPLRS